MPHTAIPPTNTAGIVPMAAAVIPALKSPSSFEALIEMELTADTRPRI